MEIAIELGAEDIINNEDGSFEVITSPTDFLAVKDGLDEAGLVYELAEITMKPDTEIEFQGEAAQKMQKILDALEDLDDVQEVYTNAVIEDV